MTSFTKNDLSQRGIIKNFIILTKQDTNKIHDYILTIYHKYPSPKILKHANVLAKVNKSTYARLLNMTPHGAYSIAVNIHTMNIADISHEQKE